MWPIFKILRAADGVHDAYSPINDAHFFATRMLQMYTELFGKTSQIITQPLKIRVDYGNLFSNAVPMNEFKEFDYPQILFGDGRRFFCNMPYR